MNFLGFEAHLMNRKISGSVFEIKVGNEFRRDKLYSVFGFEEEKNKVEKPIEYQNNLKYVLNDAYLKSKYSLKIKKMSLTGQVDFHKVNNLVKNKKEVKSDAFYVNPRIGAEWELDYKSICSFLFS